MGPRDLVLDGQSASRDTDQQSTDLTNVNIEVYTRTWKRSARSSVENEAALQSQQ